MKFLNRNHLKYALIMCAITVACLALMELTGQNESFDKSPFPVIFTFIAPAVVWYFGIKERKQQLKGKLPFKQGVIEGFNISLGYAIISPFIFLFYYLFVNPPIIEYVRTSYGLTGASDTAVFAADMAVQFVAAIIGGTVYAAIISFFLKSKK